ncbi:DUF4159 domain-containing protein [Granulosicoccus antarcticus]|uniref:DUF4159 domain-containing protein n=1 Tax=Granulosicoccus antarcticus IMCC3135 TaxID=1192854 RepID=A0A2Z2P0P7_9GAMM|nr:DUF4159 domain-containing protein [Granulosicoccus antarcticus]ASJ75708.1 hypothetical protein IMCC3135_28280 [Granulosicoccus antarcticus IMCC3135]
MHIPGVLILVLVLAWLPSGPVRANEFAFARLVYGDDGFDNWPRWQADWPEAETHFSRGLDRLTLIDVAPEGVLVRMTGSEVFDYPWIYVVEVGYLSLSPGEITRLREYLLRGGFLMVDDFHGRAEWRQFEYVMAQVFPDRAIEELSSDNEVFHVLYDLSEREQIPGIRSLMNGRTWEKGGRYPFWRGILDDQGRVMVAINFNQDIGDAWEHADEALYPARLTTQAYRLGINYVVYALTH